MADMVAVQTTRTLPTPATDEKARHDELEHPPTVDDARAAAVAVAERVPEVVRIGLFGSVARGDASPHSDIDLLVVMEDLDYPVDRPRLAGEVHGAVRRATPYPVGVVVTDVTEWARRSSLRTTIEREISRGLLTLYDNGDERRLSVAWEKAMEKASTDLGEAYVRLGEAAAAYRGALRWLTPSSAAASRLTALTLKVLAGRSEGGVLENRRETVMHRAAFAAVRKARSGYDAATGRRRRVGRFRG